MKIDNLKVYDFNESLIASGYPMQVDLKSKNVDAKDYSRAKRLINAMAVDNGAHGQFLTGVRVSFDLTFSIKAWVEAERYRFLEFVSSQSTMHRIAKFDIKDNCNEYVTETTLNEVRRLQEIYKKDSTPENYLRLLYNIPTGFETTARMTTNYRCLMNIYQQRKDHRLPEWREFCEQIRRELPYFDEFMTVYEEARK